MYSSSGTPLYVASVSDNNSGTKVTLNVGEKYENGKKVLDADNKPVYEYKEYYIDKVYQKYSGSDKTTYKYNSDGSIAVTNPD